MATINSIGSNKPIEVAFGGTGAATLTVNGVLLGNTTSPVTATSAGTTGQVLAGNTGSAPTFQAASGISLGTTNHAVQIGNASGTLTSLSVASTGQTLMGSTGADPSFTGSPSFSGSVTAGTTLTASSGAITATSGDVVITSGNLTLPTTTSTIGQIKMNGTRFITFYNSNTVVGSGSSNFTTTGSSNVFVGDAIAASLGASANSNVMIGSQAFQSATTAAGNVGIGFQSLINATTGNGFNVAVGYNSLSAITTGTNNIGLGESVGTSATTSSSSNIYFNNAGAAESNTLRIGSATGTSAKQLNVAVICGITGKTSTSGVAVLVNSSNVLGTTTSSIRFKDNIQDMGDQSSDIFKLRPVTFTYKVSKPHVDEESSKLRQFGLIAEEVEQVMPDQVTYNLDGNIESVRYLNFIPMLINEIQKLRKEVEELKRR